MKKEISFDQSVAKIIFQKYKEYILPSLGILISLVILAQFVYPQVQLFFQLREKEAEIRKKIEVLKVNLNLISGFDDLKLDSDLNTISSSLPTGKDFAAILNTVAKSSNNSGIVLGDYSFAVGELSTESAQIRTEDFIQINLAVTGDIAASKNFLIELSKRFPLSETVTLQVNGANSQATVYFYNRPFSPINFDPTKPIVTTSKKQLETLETMSSWKSEE